MSEKCQQRSSANFSTHFFTIRMSSDPFNERSLCERLGGSANLRLILANFTDEIKEDPVLAPFFTNVSISALQTHHFKLFRVIFGPEEEQPDASEVQDYLLHTHRRLFQDLGLNETHFDKVALCFVQGLQTMLIEQEIVDECVEALVPLRAIFKHGAQMAAQEKTKRENSLHKVS